MYNPELQSTEHVRTEEQAMQHYISKGRSEGRIYQHLRIIVRYTACTGLINQQYSHISAFVLAAALGAELILPTAAKRDSFAHYFSTFKEKNEVNWTADPLSNLLDVDHIVNFWQERGLRIHQVSILISVPTHTLHLSLSQEQAGLCMFVSLGQQTMTGIRPLICNDTAEYTVTAKPACLSKR